LKRLIPFLLLLLEMAARAQSAGWCVKGTVTASNGSGPIPSVHITTGDGRLGTVTSIDGKFELCGLQQDSINLLIGHTAFIRQQLTILKSNNQLLTIVLEPMVYSTDEVKISGNEKDIVKSYIPGKLTLKKEDILAIPAFLGSPDVLRGLQLLPGMQSVSEGNSGIFVRGGSPGQNFVLFDNIELMNPTHLMGVYSVFNPLLTSDVAFYKGNAPIHLSSRLSSSIIVDTYKQKNDSSNWAGNIGNIITNLTYNGQSKDGKWYFSSGIRRSYIDVLGYMARPFLSKEDNYFEKNNYMFYDWNGKLSYGAGKNKLVLTWYLGKDDFLMTSPENDVDSHSKWGNKGASLNWKTLLSPGLSMENSLSVSGYFSDFGAQVPDGAMRFATDYWQQQFKSRYTKELDKHLLRWGVELTRYDVTPQDLEISMLENEEQTFDAFESIAAKVYFSNQFQFNKQWLLYGGLAFNYYKLLSNSKRDGFVNKSQKPQFNPNLITTVSYSPTQGTSYKLSYAYNTQNIHLASIASIPLPSDVWMPATSDLPVETSHQLTLGYFKSHKQRGLQLGIEAYAKAMNNQLLVKLNLNNEELESFEDNFYQGQSIAYGAEVYVNKSSDKINYTLAYTLGWAQQQFDDINKGQWHDAKYDRRHDLNLQASYVINRHIDVGAVFIFASGNKATLPTGRYWLMGNIANDYAGVNNYRMPSYHRMDVSLNYRLQSRVFHESIINFSIINLYGRSNPYYIYYELEEGNKDYELSINAKQVSLFPIMPSVSWRFKF